MPFINLHDDSGVEICRGRPLCRFEITDDCRCERPISLVTGTRGSDLVTLSSDPRPGFGDTDSDLSRELDPSAEFLPSTDLCPSPDLMSSLAVDTSPIVSCNEMELLHNSRSISLAATKQEDNTTLHMQTKLYLKKNLWIPLPVCNQVS